MKTKSCARCGKRLSVAPDSRVYSRFTHSYYCANVGACSKRVRRRKRVEVASSVAPGSSGSSGRSSRSIVAKFVVVDTGPLFDALLDRAGIDKTHVRRLILDLQVGSAGMLYLEMFADSDVLTLDLPQGFQIGTVEEEE
jgi:hypothetical protein